MRLVTFEVPTPLGPFERIGALSGSAIVDLNFACAALLESKGKAQPQRLADAAVPPEMLAFLDMGADALSAARQALDYLAHERRRGRATAGPRGERVAHRPKDIRLKAPLPRPRALRDFFAFEEHALQGAARRKEELAPEWYQQPVYYKGNHREIYGPEDVVPWPSYTRKLDFELEIACVVGRRGRDLSPAEAAKHIAGYCILNDFSARDIQRNEMVCRMGPAKGKDFATALGPCLVTPDELDGVDDLAMSVRVDGRAWSSGSSRGRYWSFPVMLSHVSQGETVYPGDILGSGTYYKGCGLDLDRWIKPGDLVELEVEGLGVLRNRAGRPKERRQLSYPRPGAKTSSNGARHSGPAGPARRRP